MFSQVNLVVGMFEVISSPRNLRFTGRLCNRPLSLFELEELDHSASVDRLDELEELEDALDELLDDELLDAEVDVVLVASFWFACLDPLPSALLDPLKAPLFVLLPFSVLPQTVRLVDHERSSFQS